MTLWKHLRVDISNKACWLASMPGTHHAEPQQFPAEIFHVPPLEVVQVVLEAGVGVGVAVGKLVSVVLPVKAKGKGHDIVLPVVWAAVVIHVF